MSDNASFPRRTVLKGLGAAVTLPWLESIPVAHAAAKASAPPTRIAYIYVPNGIHMQDWTPKEVGSNFKLPMILEPLSKVKKKLTVFTGLTHDKARANGDGPGDHARSAATFLTASQARKTHGANIKVGVSVDQVAVQAVKGQTPLQSLELGIDRGANSGNCDSGYSCAYSANISWKTSTTPTAKEVNPRLVFERLFGGQSDKDRLRREKYKKSVLDFVLAEAQGLRRKIGINDQRKIDEYLSSVREIEQRIQLTERKQIQNPDKSFKKPMGTPRGNQDHIRLMYDLMVLAFQADVTRVSTFMVANAGSNRTYRNIGVSGGHHSLSHHGNNREKQNKIRKINRYHVEQLAYFLEKMDSIKEANGSLLDNCMIMYGCAIGDGNRHNHDNLPVLVAGSGNGKMPTNRHIKYPRNTPLANLFVSMLQGFGAKADAFGDSTGSLKI